MANTMTPVRDYLITNKLDRECLRAARLASDKGGTWLPWRGAFYRARSLTKNGLLKKAGSASMPPHVLYIITDKGIEELQVCSHLSTKGLISD